MASWNSGGVLPGLRLPADYYSSVPVYCIYKQPYAYLGIHHCQDNNIRQPPRPDHRTPELAAITPPLPAVHVFDFERPSPWSTEPVFSISAPESA